jgi:hypothetical protein
MYVIKPVFSVKQIGQTTPVAGAINRITVTFQTNIEISGDEQQNITLSGLSNAVADRRIRLENPLDSFYDAYQFFEFEGLTRFAYFDTVGEAGRAPFSLVLPMKNGMTFRNGNYKYTVAFDVRNPSTGQDAQNVTISGRGTATFEPVLMQNSQLVNGNAVG